MPLDVSPSLQPCRTSPELQTHAFAITPNMWTLPAATPAAALDNCAQNTWQIFLPALPLRFAPFTTPPACASSTLPTGTWASTSWAKAARPNTRR